MTTYPEHDTQYEDTTIAAVRVEADTGWSIERADGLSVWVPSMSPVVPIVGMPARFYGKGIGSPVRGLFLNGQLVFYRTEDEDREYSERQMYCADAAEWLRRWDDGRSVWSIEMGGLGPGYEQAIQITAAEVLRHLLAGSYDPSTWDDANAQKADQEAIDSASFKNDTIAKLGLSGAQFFAAKNLALALYRRGPRDVMADEHVKDRHIQVSRMFSS